MADDPSAQVADRWKALYVKMRDVAAGYSNMADGNTRRLDREYDECERLAKIIGTEDDYPIRVNDNRGIQL